MNYIPTFITLDKNINRYMWRFMHVGFMVGSYKCTNEKLMSRVDNVDNV